ncbi:MAG: nickel-responsive transcriptional regulator NikR [Armatimonadetes bacterium]|nr:nickel-responsive transcriptional regulator NikR [Armatimonadota bacterium]
MSELERFGVSMPGHLLEAFDQLIEEAGYASRSEALRDVVRDFLVARRWDIPEGEVVGTITLVYDHHTRGLEHTLTSIQHDAEATVICSTHVHLDHHNCIEVIVVAGNSVEVRKLANRLISTRGVKHGQLSCTAAQE